MIKKSIAIILIAIFSLNTCSYALAPSSIFQKSSPVEGSQEFNQSVLSDIKFLTTAFSIAAHFLIDGKTKQTLAKAIRNEFRNNMGFLTGVDLDGVYRKDNAVYVPFEKGGKKYEARVYERENFDKIDKSNSEWGVSRRFGISIRNKNDIPRLAYRYIGVSMGGNKLAVSVNDGNNNIVAGPYELRWDDDQRFSDKQIKDVSKADTVLDTLSEIINKLVEENGINKSKIDIIHAALAGPVDKEKGIFGSDFKTANLPFDRYAFSEELQKRLKKKGIDADILICNDAEASRNGERFSPNGQLQSLSGGIVIIGGGINISVNDESIKECGHNIVQIKVADGTIHYEWVGDKSQGGHPIERGNTARAIKTKSGLMGEGYVKLGEKDFKAKYPEYPFIQWGNGLRDFEDRLSGPNIRMRLRKAIDRAKESKSENLNEYLAIERASEDEKIAKKLGELEQALDIEAPKGNRVAIKWVKDIAVEIGQALATFIHAYQDRDFVRHLVLVSGINENLGKGVYDDEKDRAEGLDIFIKNVRHGAKDELVKYFKMDEQKAEKITNGIVRSKMTYERELVSYQPQEEEVRVRRLYKKLSDSKKHKIQRIFEAISAPNAVKEIWRFFDKKTSDRDIKSALSTIPEYARESTQFFRTHKKELEDYLDELIAEKIANQDLSIRAKSIGISSGEEPYSIAFSIYNRLKRYHKAHKEEIGVPFERWLSKWKITIEGYDRDIVSLLLTANGRFDLLYDNPDGKTIYEDLYKNIPELHDTSIWEAPGRIEGAGFYFRKPLWDLIKDPGHNLSLPYQVRREIRKWMRPIYVNIRTARDMAVTEKTKADIICCHYLIGDIHVEPFIERSLRKSVSPKNKVFFAVGEKVDVIEPEENSIATISTDMEKINRMDTALFPPVEDGKILCHIITKELLPVSVRSQFENMIDRINRAYPDLREKIKVVSRKNLKVEIEQLKSENPDYIIDAAVPYKKDLENLPEGIKALVFKGALGGAYGFRQVEGIIAALRALHQENTQALVELYQILTGETFKRDEKDIAKYIKDPQRLAGIIMFNLKPIEIYNYKDLESLNRRLLELIQAV